MHTIHTRKFQDRGCTVIVSRHLDELGRFDWGPLNTHTQTSDEEYIGISVSIRCQTASNWADGGMEVGRASLWWIDADADEEYLTEVEHRLIDEAREEVELLKAALVALPSKG